MNDDIDVFLDNGSIGTTYLESLISTRINLESCPHLLAKLDKVIEAELDLALMGAEKAKSEILKAASKNKDNLKPIK